MKTLLLFVSLFSQFLNFHSSTDKPLYVWAESGLVLREVPEVTAKKILTIPYETKLLPINQSEDQSSLVIYKKRELVFENGHAEKHPEFVLKDYWYKVKYRGKEGYVFGGYLSTYSPLKEKEGWVDFSDYFDSNFELINEIKRSKYRGYNRKVYKNGLTFEIRGIEGGGVTTIIFPETSLNEAYLFFNKIWGFEKSKSKKSGNGLVFPMKIDYENAFLQFFTGSPEGTTEIQVIGNFVIITSINHC